MKQKQLITTKQLIAKLLEVDPDGNKSIEIDVPFEESYAVYDNTIIETDDYDEVIIKIPWEEYYY